MVRALVLALVAASASAFSTPRMGLEGNHLTARYVGFPVFGVNVGLVGTSKTD